MRSLRFALLAVATCTISTALVTAQTSRRPATPLAHAQAAPAPNERTAPPQAVPDPTPASNAQASQAANSNAGTQKPSSLIAPAIDHLSQTISQIRLEHWRGPSRDETDSNLRSIERNVSTTLPQLVTAADAQPASVATSLPLLRNLDALCAVMIRVSVTARNNAPTSEAEAIAGGLTALQSARNSLSDQLVTLATAQEKQLSSLQNALNALNARPAVPPPPPPAPVPATKPKPRPRPHKKPDAPATGKPSAPASATPASK